MMTTESDRSAPASLWNRPELRTSFMEGVTAYGPCYMIAGIGALCGLLLLPLGIPVWFVVNCLFTDQILWPVDLSACQPLPPYSIGQWAAAFIWFALIGAGYVLLHRAGVRRSWLFRVGPAAFHPGHFFAVLGAVATGVVMVASSSVPGVSRAESLVMIVSCPIWLRLWWSVRLRAYALMARRLPTAACAWTVKVLLARQFRLSGPSSIEVTLDAGEDETVRSLPVALVVKGPFDAVDDRRLSDLAGAVFYDLVDRISTATTLSSTEYWRPYREELGPSGYESPPIPPPLTLPTPLIWIGGVVALLYFGYVFAVDAPRSLGGAQLEAAVMSIGQGARQMEAGLDPTRETGVDTRFYMINLRDSKDACPQLARDVMGRWRVWNESFDDRYVYRVHQVSQVDFYGFVIDGVSYTCVKETPGRNLREAQYLIASRLSAHEWIRIDDDLDWRYVPPRPPVRD